MHEGGLLSTAADRCYGRSPQGGPRPASDSTAQAPESQRRLSRGRAGRDASFPGSV